MSASAPTTHLVLIPSYNPGPKVYETVRAALEQWNPVWVVIDGSTDDSAGAPRGDGRRGARAAGIRDAAKTAARARRCLHGLEQAAAARLTPTP